MRTDVRKKSKLVIAALCIIAMIFTVLFATEPSYAIAKPHLKKANITMHLGHTYAQKLISSKGNVISNSKIKWASSKKSVATVSSKGVIKVKKEGIAKITAKYKGKSYKCTVKGKNSLRISPNNIVNMSLDTSTVTSIRVYFKDSIGYSVISGECVDFKFQQTNSSSSAIAEIRAISSGVEKIKIYSKAYPENYRILTINVYEKFPLNVTVDSTATFTNNDAKISLLGIKTLSKWFSSDNSYGIEFVINTKVVENYSGEEYTDAYACAYDKNNKLIYRAKGTLIANINPILGPEYISGSRFSLRIPLNYDEITIKLEPISNVDSIKL
ncbi:Ig-like domain-containing protein [Emergencia sp.]|uniref:Ig-like domain-containing protein n=1 Tax=Emergencia sp. TaxID=1926557 RepID=UPI003AF02645